MNRKTKQNRKFGRQNRKLNRFLDQNKTKKVCRGGTYVKKRGIFTLMEAFQTIKTQKVPRFVIILQGKHGTNAGGVLNFLACLNNMKVLFEWIKAEGGICYLQTGGAPIVLDHYQKIFRAFAKRKDVYFTIRNGETMQHFSASKVPIIKSIQ